MNEKDSELADIREMQEQIRITEEDREKRLAEYESKLQANPKLRNADALRGSKMSFEKEEEVTQEKSNKQRIKELEDKVRFLVKEKRANV